MEKLRTRRTTKISSLTKSIRSRANLMPFNALSYVSSLAMLKMPKSHKADFRASYSRLSSELHNANLFATRLHEASEPDPYSMADAMRSGVSAYVDIFYQLDGHQIARYIEQASMQRYPFPHEKNMLFVPALMSQIGEDQGEVERRMFSHLYAIPFRVLHSSSKSALKVLLMENSIAIRSFDYNVLGSFSRSVAELDTRIKRISAGAVNPIEDEKLKTRFIDDAVRISEETDINVAEAISQKVRTEEHVINALLGLVRKYRSTAAMRK